MGLCDKRSCPCLTSSAYIHIQVHHGMYYLSAVQKLFADNFLLTATNQNWSKLYKGITQMGSNWIQVCSTAAEIEAFLLVLLRVE